MKCYKGFVKIRLTGQERVIGVQPNNNNFSDWCVYILIKTSAENEKCVYLQASFMWKSKMINSLEEIE